MPTNKSKSVTKNEPGWSAPPATQATNNLQSMVDTPVDYATPIRNTYARAEADNSRSYNNPLGAYTTADVRDKSKREAHGNFMQNLGIDLSNAAQQTSADKFNRQATVAGFTQPRFYNASSTNTQPFTGGDFLSMGLGGAQGILA